MLIFFYKIDFSLICSTPLWIFERFENLETQLISENVFPENVTVFNHNKVIPDQINSLPITIDAIDPILIGCQQEFTAFLKQVAYREL